MGIARLAVRGLIAPLLLALLGAGCSHVPFLAVSHDPLTADEHVRLGASYESQGLHKDAAAQFDAALKMEPANVAALMASGNAAYEAGDLKTAEARFRRVLALTPHHPGAGNNLAMIELARNANLDAAEQLAKEALAQGGPLKPYILDTLANVYARQKRYPEAVAALDQASAEAPPGNDDFQKRLLETHAAVDAARP